MNDHYSRCPQQGSLYLQEGTGIFLHAEGHFLYLKRHPSKPWGGNQWGVPGGKPEGQESLSAAIIREVKEETGISLDDTPAYLGHLFCDFEQSSWIFHVFYLQLPKIPEVDLGLDESIDYRWVPDECLLGKWPEEMVLVDGGKEAVALLEPLLMKEIFMKEMQNA